MKKLYVVVGAVFCLLTNSINAQTDAEAKAWAEYMAPGKNHAIMEKETGSWDAKMKLFTSPDAAPQEYTANVEINMIMGGRYQESRYKGTIMGMPFEGRSILAFDNASKEFKSTWIDNMGTGLLVSKGKLDINNKRFVFEGQSTDPVDGKTITTREIYTLVDENTRKIEMFDTKDGKEHKSMEIVLTRKK
ncbi:DUF1579 domain-containing protein [Flavobacterium rhizosphaerae]|uniref:DUF1579 domain-containing protein n=1 Tax=Flavobacterium rhizosphaerae TaxID=3163298 RepID=A0ABW8YTK5_9FLAO